MNLESPKVTVQKSSNEIYNYLSEIKNFEFIMPDTIEDFQADSEAFHFTLKGMPKIHLKLDEQEAPNKIILGSTSEKFPFTLKIDIEDNSEVSSDVQLIFDGKFNPMVAMMIKNPLQKFINTLSENLKTK
ncbi:MAG: SRPBCC family protein [Flavobacteriaceae bacterium]|nr:SRPBCC family protein [Flavobacteriaceae bacterium]